MTEFYGFKGYIFDLDGTLFESMHVWTRIYGETLAALGVGLPEDYHARVNHMSVGDGAEYTVRRFGLQITAEELIAEWRARAAEEYGGKIGLKPYAAELLDALKRGGKKIGIATALAESLAFPCLERNGIAGFFSSFTSVEEVNADKDKPDVYLAECAKLGLNPHECVVVEDSIVGIRGAAAGGFFTVGVYDAYSGNLAEEMRDACGMYVRNLKELLP